MYLTILLWDAWEVLCPVTKTKENGWDGREIERKLGEKHNLFLCRQTECTKHKNWAKEPGRVSCDWTKKQWEVLRVPFTWGCTSKSVDIVQSSNKSCWLTKIYFLWSINCYLINFLMFWGQIQNYYSDPKNIILNRNSNNNLVWLKMGKWVTKCAMYSGFLLVKEKPTTRVVHTPVWRRQTGSWASPGPTGTIPG